MFDLKDIEARYHAKKRLTEDEYLHLLQNNGSAKWAFLIRNNAGNINHTLRHILGYTELGFYPNEIAIAKQISMMRERNEIAELQKVLSNFVLIEKGYSPSFIQKLKSIL